ncbi:MAG: FAD binding domain-containing protein [Candidatus Lambdaproteobacteria bacterium]|nr:FAD binding domain-containing protein [Candidatus Lambdaproteobacteria bacterium]
MTYPSAPYDLHQPASVDEAMALMTRYPDALYLAGGTDLVVNLRRRIREPGHVIALRRIGDLRGIALDGGHLTIGALTTISAVAAHPEVQRRMPALAEAAGLVAGPTIRNMGTQGGNLCLDTRCRYYNQSFFWRKANDFCLKKDGEVCHVAPGGSFCWAAYSGDTAPVLLLHDAELELVSPQGARRVTLAEFYGSDGRWSVGTEPGGLRPGELLLRVHVPLPPAGAACVYEKLRVRDSIDYPLVGLALRVDWADEAARRIGAIAMALTAVNPRPERVGGLEPLTGATLDMAAVAHLQKQAHRTGKPMRTTVADPAYRRAMIGTLVEKACTRLARELDGPLMEQARWA